MCPYHYQVMDDVKLHQDALIKKINNIKKEKKDVIELAQKELKDSEKSKKGE